MLHEGEINIMANRFKKITIFVICVIGSFLLLTILFKSVYYRSKDVSKGMLREKVIEKKGKPTYEIIRKENGKLGIIPYDYFLYEIDPDSSGKFDYYIPGYPHQEYPFSSVAYVYFDDSNIAYLYFEKSTKGLYIGHLTHIFSTFSENSSDIGRKIKDMKEGMTEKEVLIKLDKLFKTPQIIIRRRSGRLAISFLDKEKIYSIPKDPITSKEIYYISGYSHPDRKISGGLLTYIISGWANYIYLNKEGKVEHIERHFAD